VAFFSEGLLDQTIECISSCLKPGEKPVYEPIKAEQHLRERYEIAIDQPWPSRYGELYICKSGEIYELRLHDP
jgi:hypothetical protein